MSVHTHWMWSGVSTYAAGWFMLDYWIKLALPKIYFLHSSSSVANILCLTWRTPRPLGSRVNKKGLWSFFNSFLPRFHWYWTYRIPFISLASFLLATKRFPQSQYIFLRSWLFILLDPTSTQLPCRVLLSASLPLVPRSPFALRVEESSLLEAQAPVQTVRLCPTDGRAHLGQFSVLLWKLWTGQSLQVTPGH